MSGKVSEFFSVGSFAGAGAKMCQADEGDNGDLVLAKGFSDFYGNDVAPAR